MTVGSLFSGIGGFDLGFERAGFEIKWQVEIDPYCQQVLAKHWPNVRRYSDVRTVGAELEPVDVICGGFPCQPISVAGRRLGTADDRWLWPDFLRIIRAVRPRYVLVENVPGLFVLGFGGVLGDLAALGFDAEWQVLSAAQFGAPHLRARVWIMAYPSGERTGRLPIRRRRPRQAAADTNGVCATVADSSIDGRKPRRTGDPTQEPIRRQSHRSGLGGAVLDDTYSGRYGPSQGEVFPGRFSFEPASQWCVEPDVGRVAHGIPARVDRLRGLGNAIVPQIAQWIAERIKACEIAAQALAALWKLQRGRCALSGKRLDRLANLDHIVPLCQGGVSTIDNLRWTDPLGRRGGLGINGG